MPTRPFLTALVLSAAIAACSRGSPDFTGIWKGSCSDYWAVQIRPAVSGRYVVTFCGLNGCMQPGDWMPESRIVDDPAYEVVSASTIRVKRNDAGYFTYHKCSDDPAWPGKPR